MRTLAAATALLASVAIAWAAPREAPQETTSADQPELRPGDIVIKPTGKNRPVRHPPAATPPPTTRPAPRDDVEQEPPRTREVSIGFLVREPEERGWGPQIHYADYFSPSPSYGSCDYGYTSPLLGYGILRSSSYFGGYRDRSFDSYRHHSFGGHRGHSAGHRGDAAPQPAPVPMSRR